MRRSRRRSAAAPRWLLLSGTPFRSDATPIPGVRYDADGHGRARLLLHATPRRSATGSAGRSCFVAYDGTLSWRSGDDVIESSFETVLSTPRGRAGVTGPRSRPSCPTACRGSSREADAKLRAIRRGGHGDAGGLVIAADSSHARRIAALLREAHRPGRPSWCSTPSRARRQAGRVHALARPVDRGREHGLRGGRHPAAARRRVRDGGQDAAGVPPDRRAGSCARSPAARSSRAGCTSRPIRSCATTRPTVEKELRHALRAREDSGDELEFEPTGAASPPSRPSEPAFVPLSADVAPQMTLFGPPPARGAGDDRSAGAGRGRARGAIRPTTDRRSSAVRAAQRAPPAGVRGHPPRRQRATARSTRGSTASWGSRASTRRRSSELERSVELLVSRLTKRR